MPATVRKVEFPPDVVRMIGLWRGDDVVRGYQSVPFGVVIARACRPLSIEALQFALRDDWPDWVSERERGIVERSWRRYSRERERSRARR